MSKSTIQHFISKNQATTAKVITREKIRKNSESSRFLKRVNLPEELQTCYKLVDMRGKAPGPYRKIVHNGKTLYLDDLSFLIFQQGLTEHHNIFTVGTYHKIMYGQHSYMGEDALKKKSEKNHGLNLLINDQKRENIVDESQRENIIGTYSPDILPLGYSSKRKEHRLIYVMPISLFYKGKQFEVKSRDFSVNGLKVFLVRTLFISGDTVKLDFEYFIDKQNALTDNSAARFFKGISYKIIDVQHINDKTYLSLIQLDLKEYTKQTFSQFIDNNRIQYKLDSVDILTAARAKYVEHVYTHNISSIPLYLSLDKNEYRVDSIIHTHNNQTLFDFFKSPDNTSVVYNFSPFMLSHRLEYFAELAYENSNALLFVFWENNKLYSVCDFEFKHNTDLALVALKVIAQKGKVFSLNSKQIKKPEKSRLKNIVDNLLSLEKNITAGILEQTSYYISQLSLTDITEVFQYDSYFSLYVNKNENKILDVPIFCEDKKLNLNLPDYSENNTPTMESHETSHFKVTKSPKKISLNVHKVRYKPRYIYSIPINISYKNQSIKGQTVDFSQDGIGVKFAKDKNFKIKKSRDVFVSFPSFSEKFTEINFNDVHYKVARLIEHKKYLELGLIRIVEQKNKAVGKFFTKLINHNKSKLDICINDRIEQTLEHLMEAYIDCNINSIPLLISRDKEHKHYLKSVGLTEVACKLAEQFFLKLRGYNFKILTSEERLEQLYVRSIRTSKGISAGNTKEDQSFILFMYKDTNAQGSEYINSFTSFEILYQGETLNLLAKLFENNGVCIKLSFINTLETDSVEIDNMANMIASVNRHHASLFRNELADMIGLVDMVDVTSAYQAIYGLQQ